MEPETVARCDPAAAHYCGLLPINGALRYRLFLFSWIIGVTNSSVIGKCGGVLEYGSWSPQYLITNNPNPTKERENVAIEQIDLSGDCGDPGPGSLYGVGAHRRIRPGGGLSRRPHRRPSSRFDRGHEAGQAARNERP